MQEQTISKEEVLELIQRLREAPAGKPVGFPLQFRGVSLRGVDLSGLPLSGADFSEADLSGANLSKSNLFKANFNNACLVGAVLDDAEMTGANLEGSNLEGAQAQRAGLGMAILKGARMFNANLSDASLTKADLTGADVRHATLDRVRLREAILCGADCTVASFRAADLSRSDVTDAVLNNADLRDSNLCDIAGYRKAQWFGVDIRDINFSGAYLLRRYVVDENYLKEFRDASRLNLVVYRIWSTTSNCGRSLARWFVWIMAIVVLFSIFYASLWEGMADHPEFTIVAPFYYSVVTITTLGYGDLVPLSSAIRIVAMCEVFVGYVMLGGLLSIFNNKMARRGD